MNRVVIFFLSLGLLVASLPAAAAQELPSVYADTTNQLVTYTDTEGNDLMTLTVTGVNHDFAGYLDGQYADHGYTYRLVAFTLENISDSTVNVNLMTFALIDAFGFSHYRVHVEREIAYEYQGDIDVEAGDVVEQELVFELPSHVDSALFRWEPDFRIALLVNISPNEEAPAISRGLRAPAAITDDFGNEIATVEVLAVQGEWDQYSEWSAPEDGEVYWALQVRVTNTSDRPVEVRRYRFNLIDQDGAMSRATYVGMPDDIADQVFDDAIVNPGETVEGFLVYTYPEDNQPVVLVWEDRFGSTAYIILVNPSGTPDAATPEVATLVAN